MRHLTHTMSAAALALLAAFGAARPCAGAEMALGKTQLATREWVKSYLRSAGVDAAVELEKVDADVATNVVTAADGTATTNLTVTGAWAPAELTNCVSATLVVSAPRLVPYTEKAATASALRLVLMPFSLYAAETADGWTIEFTITAGYWQSKTGKRYNWDFSRSFPDGWKLTYDQKLPVCPPSAHTCEIGDDCYCSGADYASTDDVPDSVVPDKYKTTALNRMIDGKSSDWYSPWTWFDESDFPDDWTGVVKKPDGSTATAYYVVDDDNTMLNVENLAKSPAWKAAINHALLEARKHLRKCRDAYKKSLVCDKENPQHDAAKCGTKTLGRCARCGAQFGADEGHDWFGNLAPTVHYCKCGARSEKHTFGDGALVSHVGDWGTYRRACEKCGYEETYQAALAACVEDEDYHVAAKEACGCVCGKYGAEGAASTEKAMHKWSKTKDANGSVPCLCLCGRYHDARSATDAKTECKGVCASCRKRPLQNGVDVGEVADSAHTPCEPSDGHCGCKCQYLTANGTSDAAYHIQKPGTCRCMGADGNGGAWHFPEPDPDCPEVCQYRNADGTRHLASKEKAREEGLGTAPSTVHAKVESGSCGCKCGDYTSANVSDWGGANFHNRHTSDSVCGCCCGKGTEADLGGVDGYHRGYGEWKVKGTEIRDGKVVTTLARKCQCGGHEQTKEEEGALTECDDAADYHIAKSDTCGCLCGKYGSEGETHAEKVYHKWNREDGETCLCDCGAWHSPKPPSAYQKNTRTKCEGVCATCDRPVDGSGLGVLAAPASAHTPCEAQDARCGCWCGRVTSSSGDSRFHPQKPGTCFCFGADGNGGAWHYPEVSGDCGKVCGACRKYLVGDGGVTRAPVAATAADHTKYAGSGRCGCQCGQYTNDNWDEWATANFHNARNDKTCGCWCGHAKESDLGGSDRFHRQATPGFDCDCQCGLVCLGHVKVSGRCGPADDQKCSVDRSGHHFKVAAADGACPKVCHGECGEWKDQTPSKHTPDSDNCGCECGGLDHANYTSQFHTDRVSETCRCKCGDRHYFVAGDKCTRLCKYCGDAVGSDGKMRGAEESDHSFSNARCGCLCGKYKEPHHFTLNSCTCICGKTEKHGFAEGSCWCYCKATCDHKFTLNACTCNCGGLTVHKEKPDSMCKCGCLCGESRLPHKFADNSCKCYCGDTSRHHSYDETGRGAETKICETGGETLYITTISLKCSRCGETAESVSVSGHTCGETDQQTDNGIHYCNTHHIYYNGTTCPLCSDEDYLGVNVSNFTQGGTNEDPFNVR